MALPNLSKPQVHGLAGQVENYIQTQRDLYRAKASPLDNNQKAIMAPFFPNSVLDSTQVVALTKTRVSNPGFYSDLVNSMGFEPSSLPDFTQMAAITFVDTVVSHQAIENRTLFHELVHAVQYGKLGLPLFAAKYVEGFLTGGSYDAIPLEQNAYELDERYAQAPQSPFSVEHEVQQWIDLGLF